jgi:hypothetical protein
VSEFSLSEIAEDRKTKEGRIRISMNLVNFWVMLYTAVMSGMLLLFGCNMHRGVMKNVTTNEQVRRKWNA